MTDYTNGVGYTQGAGYFIVNGQQMTRMELMKYLQETYRDCLNDSLTEQFNDMTDKNNFMDTITKMMEWARENKATKDQAHDDEGTAAANKRSMPDAQGEKTFEDWMSDLGITCVDVNPNKDLDTWKDNWDLNIENLKGALTTAQTRSERGMLNVKQTNGLISASISEQSSETRDCVQDYKTIQQ